MGFFPLGAFDGAFAWGMAHAAALSRDANYAGGTLSPHGAADPSWVPLPGYSALPCRLTAVGTSTAQVGGRQGVVTKWVMLYRDPLVVDTGHMVTFVDAGVTRRLFPTGRARDEGAAGHHRVVDLVEYS